MYPGKPLPKRVLRPFIYDIPETLNEDEYTVLANSDKSVIINSLSILGYVLGAIQLVFWVALDISDFNELYIALGIISLSLTMHFGSKYLKPSRYISFNRKNDFISVPKGIISKKIITGPWVDWTARLRFTASSVGAPRHELYLIHIPSTMTLQLDTSPGGYDDLLGYWSFIVQFMSGEAYPNVRQLQDQKNLTDGIGSWEHWEKIGKYENDPYKEWLQQLKADPSLDIAYQET